MKNLSNRIKNLEESQTIAMTQKSRELKEKGIDVISLSIGEPDFNTPDFIKDAAKKAIDENFSHYPPVPGFLSLREAISHKLKRDNNLDYSPNQIVVSTGAKQSIMNVVLSLVNPGEEVILVTPYWVSYKAMVYMASGKAIELKTSINNNFKVTPEELENAITDKTKLVMFSSPSNPTGSAYSADELSALAKVISKHKDLFVISDEIYELINFEGNHHSIATNSEVYDQVITVNGVSKGFAMTGWRIGYIAAPEWIAKACTKMQGQFTSGASSISQKAAETAMLANPSSVSFMQEEFLKRRDLMLDWLNEIEGIKTYVPNGAFYIFPDVSFYFGKKFKGKLISNATDLCMYLLNEAHVGLVTGDAFGSPECLRISYAASTENLKEAVRRIKVALNKLEN